MSVLSKPLPADHLLSIFSRVSLTTLLRLPLVCTAWSSLQPTVCHQTHTLTLSILCVNPFTQSSITQSSFPLSSPSIDQTLSTLTIRHLNGPLPSPLVATLLSLFPLIRTLLLENRAFAFTNEDLPPETAIHPLVSLLRGWSHSLTHLSVTGFENLTPISRDSPEQLLPSTALCCLLATINTLPLLSHLNLDIGNYFLANDRPLASVRFSILSRLRTFSCTSYDNPGDLLLPSLRAYGRIPLTQIHLNKASFSTLLINALIREHSPLLRCISQCAYNDAFTVNDYSIFGAHLRNLTFLTLYIHIPERHSLRELLQSLAKCSALRTLALNCTNLESVPLGVDQLSDLPSCPLLTSLTLTLRKPISHAFLAQRLHPGLLFPNLVFFQLKFIPRQCTACWFNYAHLPRGFTAKQRSTLRACLRLMLAPLKECTQLQRIVIPNLDDAGNAEMNISTWEDVPIEEL